MSAILVWSPNYAPEPTGVPPLVTDACEWLAARGHRVEVVTAFPNYPERRIHPGYRGLVRSEEREGVHVTRSWLRVRPNESFLDKALYEASFAAFSAPHALRRLRGADVVVAVVPTLLSAALAAAFARAARKRLVIWLQDLVLEGARAVEGARVLGPERGLERRTMRAADRVVVCSPGFRDYLLARGAEAGRIETIGNWVDTDAIAPQAAPAGPATRFLYAGNLGYSQGFETLVEAAALAGAGIEVEIVGEGNAAAHVRRLANGHGAVTIRSPVPNEEFATLLASAHAHVVLQRRVSAGANLPSKIGPYLASGRPVIGSIDAGTPAADLLEESGGAVLVEPESPRALAEAMRSLAGDAALRARLGEAGRRYAVAKLDRAQALERLERAILRA